MNKGLNFNGGKIILWGLILTMLVFTAVRTLHFLQLTFPPDQQYVAYLALAAFDVGILGWFYYATHSAEGAAQRTVAYGMIFICMAGVCITTIADMVLVSSENGLTKLPPQWGTIGLWGVIIVIIANVAAGIIVHLVDPKHQQHMARESAKDKIHALVVSEIHQKAQEIAPHVAQQAAAYWVNQTMHEFLGHIPGAKAPQQLPSPQPPVQLSQMASTQDYRGFLDGLPDADRAYFLQQYQAQTGPLNLARGDHNDEMNKDFMAQWLRRNNVPLDGLAAHWNAPNTSPLAAPASLSSNGHIETPDKNGK